MFNLLLTRERKKLKVEYYARLGVVASLALLGTTCIGIVMLAPPFITVKLEQTQLSKELAELENTFATLGVDDTRTFLAETAEQASIVESYQKQFAYTKIIEDIVLAQGGDIRLSSFSFTPQDTNRLVVMVDGNATTRSSLVDFSDRLKEQEHIATVDLPLRDLASNSNIDFSVTLTITQ